MLTNEEKEENELFIKWFQNIGHAVVTKPNITNLKLREIMYDYSLIIIDVLERVAEKAGTKKC